MKKILASIAALAMAATMATSAFAATTLTGYEEYPGDWGAPQFVDAEGTLFSNVSTDILSEYVDTGCSITLDISYHKIANKWSNRYIIAPCNANGWEKLYATDASYIEGIPAPEVGLEDTTNEGSQKKYDDGSYVTQYYFKPDGFIQINPTTDGSEWVLETLSFNLSAEAVKYLIDTAAVNEDGSVYGGLLFQTAGVKVDSLTVDAPIAVDENTGVNPDPNAGAEDNTGSDDNASDDNADTGAEAGLALAGIALAAAAVVATKKNK